MAFTPVQALQDAQAKIKKLQSMDLVTGKSTREIQAMQDEYMSLMRLLDQVSDEIMRIWQESEHLTLEEEIVPLSQESPRIQSPYMPPFEATAIFGNANEVSVRMHAAYEQEKRSRQ